MFCFRALEVVVPSRRSQTSLDCHRTRVRQSLLTEKRHSLLADKSHAFLPYYRCSQDIDQQSHRSAALRSLTLPRLGISILSGATRLSAVRSPHVGCSVSHFSIFAILFFRFP